MSDTFSGLSCQNDVPNPQTVPQTEDNLSKLMKQMGADQKCERAFRTVAQNSSASGGFQGSMKLLGGLFGNMNVAANMQTSMAKMDDSMTEKGCGSFVTTSKRIFDSMRNINCTLTQTSSEVGVTGSASANVIIKVVPPPATVVITDALGTSRTIVNPLNELAQLRKDKQDTIDALKSIPANNKLLIEALNKSVISTDAAIRNLSENQGVLNISNSTLRATSSGKVKALSSNINSVVQKMEEDVKEIVQTAAEQKISEINGKNAKTPNIKQLITQEVDKRKEDITAMMSQNMSSSNVKMDASANIVITSPKSINIDRSTIDASAVIDMAVTSITSNSVDLGKRIARDLMTSASSSTDTSTRTAGQDDLMRAMNEGNERAIAAQNKGLVGMAEALNGPNMMTLLVVGAVVLGVSKISGGTSAASATPSATPYPYSVPMGFPTGGMPTPSVPKGASSVPKGGMPGMATPSPMGFPMKGMPRVPQVPAYTPNVPMGKLTYKKSSKTEVVVLVIKLCLLFTLCYHSWYLFQAGRKLASGNVGAGLQLLNPFQGLSLSPWSLLRLFNPFSKSSGLVQGGLKLYITLCVVDFVCKFPFKLMPVTWIIPSDPFSAFFCLLPSLPA
jgi:hypothetical protein